MSVNSCREGNPWKFQLNRQECTECIVHTCAMDLQADVARLAALGAGASGRGAATVYRDKAGRAVDEAEAARLRDADRKPEPVKPDWGGGLRQVSDQAEDTIENHTSFG